MSDVTVRKPNNPNELNNPNNPNDGVTSAKLDSQPSNNPKHSNHSIHSSPNLLHDSIQQWMNDPTNLDNPTLPNKPALPLHASRQQIQWLDGCTRVFSMPFGAHTHAHSSRLTCDTRHFLIHDSQTRTLPYA